MDRLGKYLLAGTAGAVNCHGDVGGGNFLGKGDGLLHGGVGADDVAKTEALLGRDGAGQALDLMHLPCNLHGSDDSVGRVTDGLQVEIY